MRGLPDGLFAVCLSGRLLPVVSAAVPLLQCFLPDQLSQWLLRQHYQVLKVRESLPQL